MPEIVGNALGYAWERFALLKDSSFRFEPETHQTFVRGRIPWSITGALRQSGIIKSGPWYRPEHRIRGSHVHEACHYLDDGDLDWEHFERERGDLVGYVRAWEAFKRDWNFKPLMMELPMYADEENGGMFFSGIPDRVGLILDDIPAIVEIKTGGMMFWTAFQTAGQDLLLRAWEEKPVLRRRYGVALQEDGTYKKPLVFDDDHDYDVMRGAVIVSQASGGVDRGVPPIEVLA